jgi:hypothetical protein
MLICLLGIPFAVYVASYIPWAFVENHQLVPGWPAGHTGTTLWDQTLAMYTYHNNLVDAHPASSPWWAWPFDLKPVWFYQQGLGGNTIAAIYNAGNLALWWLAIPAMAFVGWQAFARRSLPLALIAIGFACQWVSWARIDRAAFQYHYYTSLPFLVLALAYFLAELWHGASRRTWLLARLAAAIAVIGPAILWVGTRPLCGFVGGKALQGSAACPPVIPSFVLTSQTLAIAVLVGLAVIGSLTQISTLRAPEQASGRGPGDDGSKRALSVMVSIAAVAIIGSYLIRTVLPDTQILVLTGIPVEPVAMVLAIPAILVAAVVATARDARRFVAGALVAIVGWFVLVYPNFAALPLPAAIANVYQGVLPTYLYAFQFPVNNSAAKVPLTNPVIPLLLAASLLFLTVVVAYATWIWRLSSAERDADERDAAELGGGLARGSPGG